MREAGAAPSLAVLIDADNTSARYATAIFDEIVKLGEANVRRIYGDFSGSRLSGWDGAIKSLAVLQHQQRSNSKGKNAADIALVIDAMDLMHKGGLDGFCLVSSDNDFTRLAQRLREDGLAVYGFGERKTPEAFRNACSRFIYLENLLETGAEKGDAGASRRKKQSPKKAVPIIARAMEDDDEDGWVHLGTVGSRIQGAAPDFDPRSYGCANLSTLATKSGGFEVRKGPGNAIHIRHKAAANTTGKAAPVKKGKEKAQAVAGAAACRSGATAAAYPVPPARGDAPGQRRRAGLPAASPQGRPRGPVERPRLGQLARGVPLRGRRGRGRGRGPDRLPLTEWEH